MRTLAWNLAGYPVDLAIFAAFLMALPMRHKLVYTLSFWAVVFLHGPIYDVSPLGYMVLTYAILLGMPFVLYGARPLQKVLAIALITFAMVVCDFGASAVLFLMTGAGIGDASIMFTHPVETMLTRVLFIACMLAVGLVCRRLLVRDSTRMGGRALDRFALFPVSQILLLVVVMVLTFRLDAAYVASGAYMVVISCVALLCIVVDLALFVTMERYRASVLGRQRAEALERRLESCLSGYAGLAAQVEEASRLRHDLRNHLQVAGALVERGELERAGVYVADVERVVRGESADGAPGVVAGAGGSDGSRG